MTTRRKTRQSTLKGNKTEESSSSESEYSKTLKIITKLSQKYLSTDDPKKKPASTKARSKRSPDKAYDGDEENTSPDGSDTTTSVSSKSKSSLYDFDEEDPEPMTSSLKQPKTKRKRSPPVKTTVSKSKSAKSKNSPPKITSKVENKSSVPKKARNKKVPPSQSSPMDTCPVLHTNSIESPIIRSSLKGKNVSFSPNVSEIIPASFTPVVSLQRLEVDNVEGSQRQLRKRKHEPPPTQSVKSPKIKKVTPTSKDKLLKKEKSRDSGMFLSPDVVAEKDFKARAVSTPFNPSMVPIQTSLNAYRDPASLNVSPVKKTSTSGPVTPLSDYASMDSITHQLTFDDSMTDIDKNTAQNIELFTTEEDLAVNRSFQKSYKPAKRKLEKKKTMKANAKVDEWMEKMNTEFSEIEGFELSIEDNA